MAEWAAIASAITSVVATTVGTTLGVVGSVQQHKQAQANAEMEADQARYNQRLAEREAERKEAETAENVKRQREQAERLKAAQRALLGKSGAAMDSGSPLAILGASAAEEERKIRDIHAGGVQEENRMREQAKMYDYQAGVAKAKSPSGHALGLNIVGQVNSGMGNIAGTAMNYYRK